MSVGNAWPLRCGNANASASAIHVVVGSAAVNESSVRCETVRYSLSISTVGMNVVA